MLTPSDSRADFVPDLDIDFEVWSELYDLSREVASGVSAFDGEVLVGWVPRIDGRDLKDRERANPREKRTGSTHQRYRWD